MDFPLNAGVHCTDGPYGSLTAIIADPKSEKVTYVVVKQRKKPHTEYMVPVNKVKNTTAAAIELNCAISDVDGLQRYRKTEYINVANLQSHGGTVAGMSPHFVPETQYHTTTRPNIPTGQRAINPGLKVKATDGAVGEVGRLVIDPESGKVSHFVLQKGHMWGDKRVVIPLSEIDYNDGKAVTLKLDKASIAALPGFQIDRQYAKSDISVMSLQLILATFDSDDKTDEAVKTLKGLMKDKDLEILNAARLSKDSAGKASFKEMADISAKKGRLLGAITGGVIGLLGGPVGVIIGAAAGAGTGGAVAKKIDRGFSDEYLKKLQNELAAGSSALVILTQQKAATIVAETLEASGGEVIQQKLTASVVDQLAAAEPESG